tara:strand:- start:1547 stop:1900 length:354 start_codon:yes stop_codon:yes gene_type:complete
MPYKYFKLKEFACKCGCNHNNINKELLDMLEQARKMAKLPFVISSGYRCENHPESIKNPTSSHIKGLAVDIKCSDSKSRAIILDALGFVGFRRFGLHDSFIHADIDESKANPVIWLY